MTPALSMLSLAQAYLDERRRFGFVLATSGAHLLNFARFADRTGHRGPLTVQLMMDWAQGEAKRANPANWARRLGILRPFARYRALVESGTEVPCADVFNHKRRRPTPHIYTVAEIADLLAAARRLPPTGTLRPLTYETFFGLVAATGLRLSEALRLRCGDFDADGGTLTIRQTKFCKSRLVPLHPTTIAAVSQYLLARQRFISAEPNAPLFVSLSGTALAKKTVHCVFARLRAELGWVARGTLPMPRIHDLRHSFVCRRVTLWHETGADIDNAMLALSTYVGHTKVSDTYWYLTAVPDLMAVAGKRFEMFAAADAGEAKHG
ncbi:putative integrase/recombinase y4rB (plasmid) [Rhodovastum atsumiense]|uniref:Tyrosine-type recombinase/integrase n=1 Tax=Rhodovastum atsumiense TaxID=504468 RepID=A0A5M6IIK3_9PROT|nr:tyrosine-type recombinase/integrase [Rhodovastum atsumiense]KAA5608101.1 tyrosine-type recombinase/integrase [Rhodovastum atsumiense]CAH2605729.1 putative integrase/recombinase y4rB [Rhodovastum atsumiense]